MKALLPLFLLIILTSAGQAQKIVYSEISKKDSRNMSFEIVGKFKGNVIVYKNVARKHLLSKYDQDMQLVENVALDFMQDKILNVDFLTFADGFIMIYQFQKNNIVFCNAVKINTEGNPTASPISLDNTSIGFFASNKIYATSFSENKQKILVYKRNIKNGAATISTKLYDNNLVLLDSTNHFFSFDTQKEIFSELVVDNQGNFVYTKESKKQQRDYAGHIESVVHKIGIDSVEVNVLPLQEKFVDEVMIKVDNLNKNYIINALCYDGRRGSIDGLFTAVIDIEGNKATRVAVNIFKEELRNSINRSSNFQSAFDNFITQNILLKKNGGFVIVAEDFYSQTLRSNNTWNRNYYNDYSGSSNYYLNNRGYYGYRPWNDYGGQEVTRYYYNDILLASVDSSLHLQWDNLIHKKQYDVDNDNFLSYSILNVGNEIHFFFIENDRKKYIVSNSSVFSTGEIKKYPTLKSNQNGYDFMPRLSKQIGANQMIMPFVYLGEIGFAKIDF